MGENKQTQAGRRDDISMEEKGMAVVMPFSMVNLKERNTKHSYTYR